MAYDPANKSKQELLSDWAAIMREMLRRGIVRTANNPVGDIAEALVADYYGVDLATSSQKSWDLKTKEGELVQVKARRTTGGSKSLALSPIRSEDGYDFVVAVIFSEDFGTTEALKIPRSVVNSRFKRRRHVNGRVITITDSLRQHEEVIDLADEGWDAT